MAINLLAGDSATSSYQSMASVKPIYSGEKAETNDSGASVKIKKVIKPVAISQSESEIESTKDGNPSIDSKEKVQQVQTVPTSMKSASKTINSMINMNTVAEFGFYENTNRIIIKIKDKTTNEVIKEIPSEKALDMLVKAWELAGMMVDESR